MRINFGSGESPEQKEKRIAEGPLVRALVLMR
jgi:hypothetical protein